MLAAETGDGRQGFVPGRSDLDADGQGSAARDPDPAGLGDLRPAIEGREVAAPPWSAACMTDHGPSLRGDPICVYSAGGGHKNALSPQIDAPHRNGANKTHDDWPANMILG